MTQPGRPDAAAPRRPGRSAVSGRPARRTAACRMRSASRWAPRSSPASGGSRQSAAAARRQARPAASTSASSSSMPPLAHRDRGDDRARRARATAARGRSRMPRLRAMSIMLSASTTGRPTCFSSSDQPQRQAQVGGVGDADDQVGRGFACELAQHGVARDLLVRACGRAANRCRAGRGSRATRPAGVVRRPSFFSTVTPG